MALDQAKTETDPQSFAHAVRDALDLIPDEQERAAATCRIIEALTKPKASQADDATDARETHKRILGILGEHDEMHAPTHAARDLATMLYNLTRNPEVIEEDELRDALNRLAYRALDACQKWEGMFRDVWELARVGAGHEPHPGVFGPEKAATPGWVGRLREAIAATGEWDPNVAESYAAMDTTECHDARFASLLRLCSDLGISLNYVFEGDGEPLRAKAPAESG